MDPSYRVLVSSAKLKNLSREQQRFLRKFNEKVTTAGVRIVDMDEVLRLEDIASEIRKLQGLIAVAFGQWQGQRLTKKKDKVIFPTEFNHLHIAIAAAAGRPLLIVKEKSVSERGTLRPNLGCRIVKVPSSLDPAWLGGPEFEKQFESWLKEVKAQRDVFLGYCSKSKHTAAEIQLRIEKLGASVLNWAMDFRAGVPILSEVEKARAACSCGVFLFSEDDPLEGAGGAAPRDNVVFEAGYFMSSKGPDRCLIIRRGEAKMPADVGGDIYVHLGKTADVSSIEGQLGDFLKRNL